MLTYLNDGFDEFNLFRDVNSFSTFDNISPFDSYAFPAYTEFSEGIQVGSDRAFSPLALDKSSGSSSSRSVSAPVAIDDSDLNHSSLSISTFKRRRFWRSLRRTLPARIRLTPPSRNKQASQATSQVINRVLNNNNIEKINKFVCPECGWTQINKRVPDFKRHLKTHLRPKDDDHLSGYWCKGVRVEDARHYAIPSDATRYSFQGHERIGGCMRTFSRRDALKRHLDNTNISCVREILN